MTQLSKEWTGRSVSYATLREEDLIPAFERVLDVAGVEYERPALVDKLLLGQPLADSEWEEVGYYVNETLFDLLDGIAPEGTSFGAHPGNGSDFGFWEAEKEHCT